MMLIDPHAHMISRTTDDYEAMANAGVVALIEPAFWIVSTSKKRLTSSGPCLCSKASRRTRGSRAESSETVRTKTRRCRISTIHVWKPVRTPMPPISGGPKHEMGRSFRAPEWRSSSLCARKFSAPDGVAI